MTKDSQAVDRWATVPSSHTDFFIPHPDEFPLGRLHSSEDVSKAPKIFTPLKIKDMVIENRTGVSPMCMYSAASSGEFTGHATPFHVSHYSAFAMRSPGLIIVEATAVNPQGRLSPNDLGLWNDGQALSLKKVVDFVHSQGVKIGIQLGHGGRKASGFPIPIHSGKGCGKEYDGWEDTIGLVGPSAIPFEEGRYATPKALTKEEIKGLVADFKAAALRAYDIAGFDFVEVHAAHGYLCSEFLSSLSNHRTDEYGGSLENRARLLAEICDAVKDDKHPLFVRISATDMAPEGTEGAFTVDQAAAVAEILAEHGVDFLDVSDGGNYSKQLRRSHTKAFQLDKAKYIKERVGDKLIVSTVGGIQEGKLASDIIDTGDIDVILSGHAFLKNPGLILSWADELGVRINIAWPYRWPYFPSPYSL